MSEEAKSLKEQLRAATLGSGVIFKTQLVDVGGLMLEVREPSVELWGKLLNRSQGDNDKLDLGAFAVWTIIFCSFVPGTDELVYSEEDFKDFLHRPKGGFVRDLENAATKLISANSEVALKN